MSADMKQIYIVDDDESVRCALKLLMVSYKFRVDTFSSAEEFFSAVPDSTPGCLLLDIHMPGLNGWDIQQRLMETGSNRPVIVITADKDDGFKEKGFKLGAVGILYKPFEEHYLLQMVCECLLR